MKKLFLILLFIVIASFQAHAAMICTPYFEPQRPDAETQIEGLIAPQYIKKSLLKQVRNPLLRDYIAEYLHTASELYMERFADAVAGKGAINFKSIGFSSIGELQGMRQDLINKQIKILSIMNAEDLTEEFSRHFKIILTKAYDDSIHKKDLLQTLKNLDSIDRMYSLSL